MLPYIALHRRHEVKYDAVYQILGSVNVGAFRHGYAFRHSKLSECSCSKLLEMA